MAQARVDRKGDKEIKKTGRGACEGEEGCIHEVALKMYVQRQECSGLSVGEGPPFIKATVRDYLRPN